MACSCDIKCFSFLTCLNIGTPKNINFPFGTNGKLMILGVPILKLIKGSLKLFFAL